VNEHVPYTYRVFWTEEDAKWIGTCTEFPSLSHLAPEPGEAATGIRDLARDVARDMRANREPVPGAAVVQNLIRQIHPPRPARTAPAPGHRSGGGAGQPQPANQPPVVDNRHGPRRNAEACPGSKRKKAADEAAPARGSQGGASGNSATAKQGRKKARPKRPIQAAQSGTTGANPADTIASNPALR
jgi:hypothetical protein